MRRRQRRPGFVSIMMVGLGICLAWLCLAPIQIGGRMAFVLIKGNSMLPTLKRGDLVLLHTASEYAVGDIVVYREPDIGPVIHRIIEEQEGCFRMQGDHNDFIDRYCPTQADIVAKYWIHIPTLGRLFEQLQSPQYRAAVAGLMGVIIMSVLVKPNQHAGTGRAWRRSASYEGDPALLQLIFVFGIVCAAFLGLAVYAFRLPPNQLANRDLNYQHEGEFAYTANAPADIYDAGYVQSGDPVFRKVVDRLQVSFTYGLVAAQSSAIEGTYRLNVEMSSVDGWRRTFELVPETSFSGVSFTATDEFTLSDLQSTIDTLESRVGVDYKSYTVTFLPEVKVTGRIGQGFLADTFAPRIAFDLNDHQLRLIGSDPGASLTPVMSSSLTYAASEPSTFTFLKKSFHVSTLRGVAVIGAAVSLLGVGVLALWAHRMAAGDAASRVQQRYGSQVVSIAESVSLLGEAHTITVTSIDDLARIAEQHGTMIMCHSHNDLRDYYVQTDRATFCYRLVCA